MFAIRNLSVLNYANGFTMWHYKATDIDRKGIGSRFFCQATDMIASGDMLIINCRDGDLMAWAAKDANGVLALTILAGA